jgi:hypothetical protein
MIEIWPADYHFDTPGMDNRTTVLIIVMCIWVTTYDIITLYIHCTFIVNNLCGIWGCDSRLMSCRMLWHAVWWKFTNIVWKPTDFPNTKDGGSEFLQNMGKCLLDHTVSHTYQEAVIFILCMCNYLIALIQQLPGLWYLCGNAHLITLVW